MHWYLKHFPKALYYIAPVEHLLSILEAGILSRERAIREERIKVDISNQQILQKRQKRTTPDGRRLSEYANLFFQPRNPMLFRLISEKKEEDISILEIEREVLSINGTVISFGNAASDESKLMSASKCRAEEWKEIEQQTQIEKWRSGDSSKRKIMAECLIPDRIDPKHIKAIYVVSLEAKRKLQDSIIQMKHKPVIVPEPYLFFKPSPVRTIGEKIRIVEGDMFFSQMHTLTISVNTVKVMGKGLASRAKYLFPDVYVRYQEVCGKKLRLGQPYLYKREISIEEIFMDYPIGDENHERWFLLFPTKRHWGENADLKSIEKGLEWVVENYKKEGIKSLALPSLGAGLGGLKWYQVGPLMVRKLRNIDVEIEIYLPLEQKVPMEQLEEEFLIG